MRGNRSLPDQLVEARLVGGHGGGIENSGTLAVADSLIDGNEVTGSGGGLWNLGGAVTLERVTVSSDGNGSLPVFDAAGKLVGLTVASPLSLLKTFRSLVSRKVLTLEQAAGLFSTNPASIYLLKAKGAIELLLSGCYARFVPSAGFIGQLRGGVKPVGRILLIGIGVLWIVPYWMFDLVALAGSVLAFLDRKVLYYDPPPTAGTPQPLRFIRKREDGTG